MPELQPGRVLVFMRATRYDFPVFNEGHYYGSFPLYQCNYHCIAQLQVNYPYRELEACVVQVTPDRILANDPELGEPTHMLAILADYQSLLAPESLGDTGTILLTPDGLPVAGYEIARCYPGGLCTATLIEGEDVRVHLPARLPEIEYEYVHAHTFLNDRALRSRQRQQHRQEALVPHSAEPLLATRRIIAGWQEQGLMPEVEPGRFLVWKLVKIPLRDPQGFVVQGMMGAPYMLDEPYANNASMVCAGPAGPLRHYHHGVGGKGLVVAILAERDALFAARGLEGVFYALKGTPVACYEATGVADGEFEYKFVEGVDALAWVDSAPAT